MIHKNNTKPSTKRSCKYCSSIITSKNIRKVICGSNDCKKERARQYMKEYRENPAIREKEKENQAKYREKRRKNPEYSEKQRSYMKEYRLRKKRKLNNSK